MMAIVLAIVILRTGLTYTNYISSPDISLLIRHYGIYSMHNYTIRAPDKTCMSSDKVIYNAYTVMYLHSNYLSRYPRTC